MADSIEIRLDQLTSAIKGLYAKSSNSQGEIYNALTTLSQRYENLTNVSSEKIASTLVNEFRKSLDAKYGQTNELIKELEDNLREFASNISSQNPKLTAEIARLINETTNASAKLNSQDLTLQKIMGEIELQKNLNPTEEIVKLSDNFLAFSRGFENITTTLNKNFADFLAQVREVSSKDEIDKMSCEIDVISGNVNSVISAISIIDTKYRDLTGLIDIIQDRENTFNDALRGVSSLIGSVESLKEHIDSINYRDDIQVLNSDMKNQVESLKYEIQKIINTTSDSNIKNEIYGLSDNINALSINISNAQGEISNFQNVLLGLGNEIKDVHNVVQKVDTNRLQEALSALQNEMRQTQDTVSKLDYNNFANVINSLTNELNNVKGLINDEILYKSHKRETEFQNYLNGTKEDINALISGLGTFKQDLSALTEGNIKILQEPIEKALEKLQNQDFSADIQLLSNNLKNVAQDIEVSIDDLLKGLKDMSSESSVQVMNELKETIPNISSNFENFKQTLLETAEKIQLDTKNLNTETLDMLKLDLQKLSDHLIDNIEGVNYKVQSEFINFKGEFQEFTIKQTETLDTLLDKLTSLEMSLENFSEQTLYRVQDTINANNALFSDGLAEIKGDILSSVSSIENTNRNTLKRFETKVDRLLDSYLGVNSDSLVNKKSLRETVVDIETKIERTNLQQIHNAKELLEEIQATGAEIQTRIANFEGVKLSSGVSSSLSEALKNLETKNTELNQEVKEIRGDIEEKLKDNVQKIAALVEKLNKEEENPSNPLKDIGELSSKIDEHLSNIEFLKNNISQEIKENLKSEFSRLETEIKHLRTAGDNPDYTYNLEDVESDLAKICLNIEKNTITPDELKTLSDKIVELKNLGVENVKRNRDLEAELGHLTGWCKDAVTKIEDVSERLDEIQNIGFADIKTRLVQSEKSKHDVAQQSTKIENALKALIKNARSKDEQIALLHKKVELITKNQAEGFDPAQFIDIFYENMTQTKMLSNRVEIIEDKINSIQGAIDKLLSYVEN